MSAYVNWVFQYDDPVFRWNQHGTGGDIPPVPPGTHKRLYHNWLFYDDIDAAIIWQNAGGSTPTPPPPPTLSKEWIIKARRRHRR